MKVRLISDLHLEASKFKYKYCDEDVLLFAGDIAPGMRGFQWIVTDVLPKIRSDTKVIYVPGNHEYYNQDIPTLNKAFRTVKYPQLEVAINRTVVVGDVAFCCTPLWTNYDLYGNPHLSKMQVGSAITDFYTVLRKGKLIKAPLYERYYNVAIRYLNRAVVEHKDKTRILVTHWCAPVSVDQRYGFNPVNAYFATKLPYHLYDQFKWWFHGHTHDSFWTEIGECQVICNPKGYNKENERGFDDELIIEI